MCVIPKFKVNIMYNNERCFQIFWSLYVNKIFLKFLVTKIIIFDTDAYERILDQ